MWLYDRLTSGNRMGSFFSRLFGKRTPGPNPTVDAIVEESQRETTGAPTTEKSAAETAHKTTKGEVARATREAARAERLARSGSKEMNSVMVTKEDAEREEAEILGQGRTGNDEAEKARQAQEEAERAAKEAVEKEREAKAAQETAERTAREAEQKANEATAALKELERKWTKGIQPEVWPTIEELEAAKERYEYTEGSLHFAIAGVAGSGKSSLINAVRCLHNKKAGAAPTGVVETTTETTLPKP